MIQPNPRNRLGVGVVWSLPRLPRLRAKGLRE